MDTTRPQRHVLGSALRRFGVIGLLVGIVCGVVATHFVEQVSTTSYTAQGSFIVPLRDRTLLDEEAALDPRAADAYQASGLASNYAPLLTQDQAVLAALTEPTGLDAMELARSIEAVALPSSGVVRVTFTADAEEPVTRYFETMNALFSGGSPTANIPAGTLQPLGAPAEVTRRAGLAPVAPLVGGLAGLVLGLAFAIVLERLLAQVRSAADVRALAPWPVLELRGRVSPERYETLVLRVLEGSARVRRVAVVTVAGMSAAAGAELAQQLRAAEERLRRSGRIEATREPISWDQLGRLLDDSTVERSVQDADAVVLGMRRKALLRPATGALQRLADLAVDNVLVVLGAPRGRSGDRTASRHGGDAGAGEAAAASPEDGASRGASVAAPVR